MATFGAKYPIFAPIVEEPDAALPIYGTAVRVGRLVGADLTITLASGKLYADDELAESVDEFSSGSLAMTTDDMEDNVASVVYGAEVKEKEVHYKAGDNPPVGGLGYYKALMRRGKKFYKGYFYPRAKAMLGNDTAATKADSITFGTESTTFTIFRCNTDDWRITETFDTEAAAKEWVDKQFKPTRKAETPVAAPAAGTVQSGTSVALSSTTQGAVIHYTKDGSEVSESSEVYSDPIEIQQETTIKAISVAEGYLASDPLEAKYTISE